MKRVLIIDDEPDIREITKISLELTKQWDVLTAGSSQDGIAIAMSQQPDAILLDVMMPDVDGLATLTHLKTDATTQPIPVIMLTATANLATHRQYAE
ncbi:MAG: response regulator [Cyanobacteriota bacterium SKYGB_h_bin112]|nr:response regulator [Cyanobacteriota bacterium SKYGB_h_bin112]